MSTHLPTIPNAPTAKSVAHCDDTTLSSSCFLSQLRWPSLREPSPNRTTPRPRDPPTQPRPANPQTQRGGGGLHAIVHDVTEDGTLSATSPPSQTVHAQCNTSVIVGNTSHAPSNTSHALSNTSHAPSNTSHAPSNTSHAPSNTSHAPSNTSHAPSNTSHAPSNTSHAPSDDPSGEPQRNPWYLVELDDSEDMFNTKSFKSKPNSLTTSGASKRPARDLNTPDPIPSREKKPRDAPGSGACGLCNLGNTCYLNSVLQCLVHLNQIRELFTGENFAALINLSNPLGTRGQMVTAFGELVADMWSGDFPSLSPTHVKQAVEDHAEQFRGFDQHDAQELLAFTLDALHEDLNQVRDKPYITKKECNNLHDEPATARQSWQDHLARNTSRIVDIFHGQLRSQVMCDSQDCDNMSVTFDPFSILSLPLKEPHKTIRCLIHVRVAAPHALLVDTRVEELDLDDFLMDEVIQQGLYRVSATHRFVVYAEPSEQGTVRDVKQCLVDVGLAGSVDDLWNWPIVSVDHDGCIASFVDDNQKVANLNDQQNTIWAMELFPLARRDQAKRGEGNLVKRVKGNLVGHENGDPATNGFRGLDVTGSHPPSDDDDGPARAGGRENEVAHRENSKLNSSPLSTKTAELKTHTSTVPQSQPPACLGSCANPIPIDASKIDTNRMDVAPQVPTEAPTSTVPSEPGGPCRAQSWKDELVQQNNVQVLTPTDNPFGSRLLVCAFARTDRKGLTRILRVPPILVPLFPRRTTCACVASMVQSRLRCLLPPASAASLSLSDAGSSWPDGVRLRWITPAKHSVGQTIELRKELDSSSADPFAFPDPEAELVVHIRTHVPTTSNAATNPQSPSASPQCQRSNPKLRIPNLNHTHLLAQVRLTAHIQKMVQLSSPPPRKCHSMALSECIEFFMEQERLNEREEWFCTTCNSPRRAFKRLCVRKCPDVLVFHLKRFRFQGLSRGKIDAFVDFPIRGLDMTKYVNSGSDGASSQNNIFDLVGVVNHHGGLGGGHYTAHAKVGPVWMEFDDSFVTKVENESVVQSPQAYVLFYQRRHPRG